MSAPADELRETRFVLTQEAQRVADWRARHGYPGHAAPFSCLVAAMGNHWEPGCYEAVFEMCKFAREQEYVITFYEEPDRCYQPYDAIGTMRNHAYNRALAEGDEYLCYVDNDVRPPPETLVKLMHRMVAVVAPVVRFPAGLHPPGVAAATIKRNQGLAMVRSVLLSFVVLRAGVFRPLGGEFWENALGAAEEYHWDKLFALTGHLPFIDTDVEVEITKLPTYPLDAPPRDAVFPPGRAARAADELWTPPKPEGGDGRG